MAANGLYDASLLADAPLATRAERQEGYNIDLLNQPSTTQRPPQSIGHSNDHTGYGKEDYVPAAPPPPQSFWRTKKGAIVIGVVGFLVLVAIIVGAAVGVSEKNRKNKQAKSTPAPILPTTAGAASSSSDHFPSIVPSITAPSTSGSAGVTVGSGGEGGGPPTSPVSAGSVSSPPDCTPGAPPPCPT